MRVECTASPLRKKDHFTPMPRNEVLFMQDLKVGELGVERGTIILMEGSSSPQLSPSSAGWECAGQENAGAPVRIYTSIRRREPPAPFLPTAGLGQRAPPVATLARFRERKLAIWHAGQQNIPDVDHLVEVGMVEDLERDSRPLL